MDFAFIVQRIGQGSSKAFMQVRFLLNALLGIVAQLVEQFPFKELVSGSIPDDPTILLVGKWQVG